MLPVDTIRQLLRYESETGRLFWLERPRSFFSSDGECRRWNGRYAGRVAFSANADGYLDGYILRVMHRAHRVAWCLHFGIEPDGMIDHINGDRSDNRIENLRLVSPSQNAQNASAKSTNTSGSIGVSRCNGKWRATIRANGKQVHLGLFVALADAVEARKRAESEYGYHRNHGRRGTEKSGFAFEPRRERAA